VSLEIRSPDLTAKTRWKGSAAGKVAENFSQFGCFNMASAADQNLTISALVKMRSRGLDGSGRWTPGLSPRQTLSRQEFPLANRDRFECRQRLVRVPNARVPSRRALIVSVGSRRLLGAPPERLVALPASTERQQMRDLPRVELFPSDLIGEMHTAFETVCAAGPTGPSGPASTVAGPTGPSGGAGQTGRRRSLRELSETTRWR
jgi:hypothetical protein